MTKNMNHSNRNVGLDLVRILAMVLVFYCHATVFRIGQVGPFVRETALGVPVVELFFALSGYLYGLSAFKKGDKFSVRNFYINRVFRILPVYYAALIWTKMINHNNLPPLLFTLLQNYRLDLMAFMPVSWSLCIEEWSYIILAILFLLLCFLLGFDKRKAMLSATILIILISLALRIYTVMTHPEIQWDDEIRKQTLLRMDTFGIGILVGFIEYKFPDRMKKWVLSPFFFILTAGLLALSLKMGQRIALGVNTHLELIVLFPVATLGALGLVLIFGKLPLFQMRFFQNLSKPIAFLSALTYPLYLMHFQYFINISNYCAVNAIFETRWYLIGAIAAAFAWALAVHFIIELPFNKLRKLAMEKFGDSRAK